ncbi:hypothetical protein [Paenibacillus sp. Pae108]|uniref:hypothetical protein n=1 Tax=Paenibacillus sp. Pae108 TaxID=2926019 RepID=UPI002118B8B4|nr:hypothetical protein [Paenibacillus sp. Pae108]
MSQQPFSTGLSKITNTFAPMIEQQLSGNGINMDQYSKQCVVAAISAINNALDMKGINWNDHSLDKNNITQILLTVASLKLNASASPREVYFQVRNVNVKVDGKDNWKKQIEMGIEGDGNDAILSNFGRNIEKVYPFWLVREGDHFEYPKFKGVEYEPPVWSPTGKGEVVRIVYPVLHKDKTIHYYIGEREDVAKNLIAHISNNLMNETFGFAENRFKATPDEKKKIDAKKLEVLKKAKELGLAALDDPELQKWISPAWTEFQSRESMIIRKIRNNIVKKIPKDFGSAFIEMIHSEATDADYSEVRREISENANQEIIDVEHRVVEEPPARSTRTEEKQADPTPPPQQEHPAHQESGQQELNLDQQHAAPASGPDSW